jgi:hypothetical protein
MPFPPQVLTFEEQADFEVQVGQEDPNALGPGQDRNWWAWAVAAFRYAGGNKPESPEGADCWRICHLYSSDEFILAKQRYHFTQSANLVAVHPVVQHLMAQYPCIVKTMQQRVFETFMYDPRTWFSPGEGHDICGFQAQDPDDVPPEYYLEMIEFPYSLKESLKEHGYTDVQMTAEAGEPDCYRLNMRRENNALDAVGVRQQLGQIVSEIPATREFRIMWRVLQSQSVAIVQGAEIAAAIRVKHFLGNRGNNG